MRLDESVKRDNDTLLGVMHAANSNRKAFLPIYHINCHVD